MNNFIFVFVLCCLIGLFVIYFDGGDDGGKPA